MDRMGRIYHCCGETSTNKGLDKFVAAEEENRQLSPLPLLFLVTKPGAVAKFGIVVARQLGALGVGDGVTGLSYTETCPSSGHLFFSLYNEVWVPTATRVINPFVDVPEVGSSLTLLTSIPTVLRAIASAMGKLPCGDLDDTKKKLKSLESFVKILEKMAKIVSCLHEHYHS